MICVACGAKMKCIYSIPAAGGRYRVYRCEFDKTYRETVELDIGVAGECGASVLEAGKKRRLGMLRAIKRSRGRHGIQPH